MVVFICFLGSFVFFVALWCFAGFIDPKETVIFCDMKASILARRFIGGSGFLFLMSIFIFGLFWVASHPR
ncbi:MAG: hypothetical protein A2V69_02720 [Candidatus Portnoybacteria bacterium RBG_13_40_8]|uniref:Uncharacterized protein n=1 Tax=Candidatus Portnoybacteria bacterium RBG_13_40_8 TaxID=1801990 RepID=A0A1G2F530_9BACT|nr:MAG: hypothetical protein A2V69_02720 [Candidatus Portnoybacteria bacterium RBG_13_40_8]